MIPLRDSARLSRVPVVTIVLLGGTVVAYLVAIASGGSLINGPSSATVVHFGAIPYELAHLGEHCELGAQAFSQAVLCTGQHGVQGAASAQPPTWLTVFTSVFVHANVLHLVIDLAFLRVFAAALEEEAGPIALLVIFFAGAIAGIALAAAADAGSAAPLIGPGGALAAVIAARLVLAPQSKVVTVVLVPFFFNVVEAPAALIAAVWVAATLALDASGLATKLGDAGAAYQLLGGAALGLLAAAAITRVSRGPLGAASDGVGDPPAVGLPGDDGGVGVRVEGDRGL
ncbi:MAG TPA: rhomboid family intramembrane serine protease [Solirubrobacteraceae bacterium]|nr:rhomboid family intramembrane serine protease [Solirubrobacteraceae bacterium]